MGLRGEAAIVGFHELPAERTPTGKPEFLLEQWARLAAAAVADAGLSVTDVDGLVTTGVFESEIFVPSTVVEYLGLKVNFAEYVDLGGASAAAMVWRAAAAIELGICEAVLCAIPANYLTPMHPDRLPNMGDALHFGASSFRYGSPQAEFEIPYGYLGQNGPYAQVAQMYAAAYGYDERAMAKIVVDQRVNANHTPGAVFADKPVTVEDVLASPIIAAPLHMLEIVMPCMGGSAVLVTGERLARKGGTGRCGSRDSGNGCPTSHRSMPRTPDHPHATHRPAGLRDGRADTGPDGHGVDLRLLHHHGPAHPGGRRVLRKGKGMQFVSTHDLTFRGDFPMNTAGGQLGYGQPGNGGGMHHVCDATRQLMGRAGQTQLADCNRAFVSGNGGVLSEQEALVLEGD